MPAWVGGWAVGYFARQRRNRVSGGPLYAFLNDKTLNLRDELEEHYKKLDITPKEFIEKYDEYEKRWLQLRVTSSVYYIYRIALKRDARDKLKLTLGEREAC